MSKNINIVDSIFKRSQKAKDISALFGSQTKAIKDIVARHKKNIPIGIDISTNSFKIAKVLPSEKSFILSDLIMEEFSWDVIHAPIQKKMLLPKILRMSKDKYKLSNQVYASISSAQAQIKHIHLAPMPNNEIESAVNWEMQQTSLRKPEENTFDYIVLNQNRVIDKDAVEVLAVIAARKDILEYIEILESAGFIPLAIEVDSLSTLSCLNFMNQVDPQEMVIFLELGAGISTINIVENNQLRLVRNVSLNGNLLNSLIQERLNLSSEEAEEAKKNFDINSPDSGSPELASIMQSNVDSLVLDIEHTFKYYSYQLTRSRVGWFNRIVLSGGCASLKNIDKYLSSRLDVPVLIADPLRRLNISQNVKEAFPNIEIIAPRLSVCIGLALRGQIEE